MKQQIRHFESSTSGNDPIEFSFKPIKEPDYQLLHHWLQLPHIKEWWDDGDDTLEKVKDH